MAVDAADVVVVGAGVAGVAAAVEASARGARVVVIDAADHIGGTARISGGGMCIAGSPVAAARKSLGGVRTDENCQVLRASGDPVPGLFAAGEVAGMAGGHINGQAALEGTMLGPSMFSGRVAGRVV